MTTSHKRVCKAQIKSAHVSFRPLTRPAKLTYMHQISFDTVRTIKPKEPLNNFILCSRYIRVVLVYRLIFYNIEEPTQEKKIFFFLYKIKYFIMVFTYLQFFFLSYTRIHTFPLIFFFYFVK